MAQPIRTSVIDILTAIQTRLSVGDWAVVTPDCCKVIRYGKDWIAFNPNLGFPFIQIRAGGIKPIKASEDGGGRIMSWKQRRIQVKITTRLDLDQAGQDDIRLLTGDTIAGDRPHYGMEEDVDDALLEFIPVDSSQNALTVDGMQHEDGSDAQAEANPSYTSSIMTYIATYQPIITQG